MKTVTVSEAEGKLSQLLVEAARGDLIVLTDGKIQVTLTPRDAAQPFDPEEDCPELEAELLKAVNGPHAPLAPGELREIAKRVAGGLAGKHTAAVVASIDHVVARSRIFQS